MNAPRDRLRIALQKSGRIAEPSLQLLRRGGLVFRSSRDRLFLYGENLPVDVLLVRDDDIPGLMLDGSCELGIVGRNVLLEQAVAARGGDVPFERVALGFGRCRLSIAVPVEAGIERVEDLANQRIATSYPGLLAEWLAQRGISAGIVTLSGSVEIAPRLGKADAVCDLVSTGATLAANQLRELGTILESEAVLAVTPRGLPPAQQVCLDQLCARIQGTLSGDGARLLMFKAPRAALARITELLPAGEPPSVMCLDGQPDTVSLQTMCRSGLDWQHLEALKQLGAHSVMVLNVEQALA